MTRSTWFLAILLAALVPSALAQSQEQRRVVLVNGDIYVGTVQDERADPLVIVTRDGVERRFSRDQIASVGPLIRGRFYRTDPVGTRLFFAPTARTLGAGEFRGDLTILYPSVTAGLTDGLDLLATGFVGFGDGAFIAPLLGLKGRVYESASMQVAVGTSAIIAIGSGGNDDAFEDDDLSGDGFLGVPYAVATFGDETRAVSLGLGGVFGGSISSAEFEVTNTVVVGLGGELQLSNGVKLLGESFLGLGEGDSGLLVLPGVRFFGDRFAFDLLGFVATDFQSVGGFAPIAFRVSYAF